MPTIEPKSFYHVKTNLQMKWEYANIICNYKHLAHNPIKGGQLNMKKYNPTKFTTSHLMTKQYINEEQHNYFSTPKNISIKIG